MRDIRCKFAAECVALFALGHIQQNQHRTGQTVIAHNRICDELHRGIIHCNGCCAADAVKRLPDQRAEGLCIAEIIDREIILAGILLPEELQCRMVIGEHPARCTDKQQTFLHIIRQHLELFLLTGQLVHLCVDLRLETRDLTGERLQLRILLERRFGIKPQLFQLHCNRLGIFVADEIKRNNQHRPDKDTGQKQLQYQPEIIFRREQQRIHQQAEDQGHPHGDQQFAEHRFFHSVASVMSE